MSYIGSALAQRIRTLVDINSQNGEEGQDVDMDDGMLFEQQILNVLKKVNPEKYGNVSIVDIDVRSAFVNECADVLSEILPHCVLLEDMTKYDNPGEIPPPVTIKDTQNVQLLLQIIVGWGIYPALLPGIGVSLSWRIEDFKFDLGTTRKGTNDELFRYSSLLFQFYRTHYFGDTVMEKHCLDMVTPFLQLLYAPGGEAIYKQPVLQMLNALIEKGDAATLVRTVLLLISTHPPAWFGGALNKMMSLCIARTGGLFALLDSLVGSVKKEDKELSFDTLVKKVVTIPRGVTKEKHFASIVPQTIGILLTPVDKIISENIIRVTILIIRAMMEMDPVLCEECGTKRFLYPMYVLSGLLEYELHDVFTENCEHVIANEDRTAAICMIALRLLETDFVFKQTMLPTMWKVFPAFFALATYCSKNVSSIKSSTRDIVKNLIFDCLESSNFKPLDAIIFHCVKPSSLWFVNGPSGGTMIATKDHEDYPRPAQKSIFLIASDQADLEWERAWVDLFVSILAEFKGDRSFASTIFLNVLSNVYGDNSTTCPVPVLLVPAMLDKFQDVVVKDVAQLTSVLSIIFNSDNIESIQAGISILAYLLSGETKFMPEEAFLFESLVPALVAHRSNMALPQALREDIGKMVTAILDPEAPWLEQKDETMEEPQPALKVGKDGVPNIIRVLRMEMMNPILSSRSSAIVRLQKLIKSQDPSVTDNIPHIVDFLMSQLAQSEQFVYCSIINAVTSIGRLYPQVALEKLTRAYANAKIKTNVRVKIGEALLQVIMLHPSLLPFHIQECVACIFASIRTGDNELRSSALSVLTSLIDFLSEATFQPFATEAVAVVAALLRHETDFQVRRAASACSMFLANFFISNPELLLSENKQPFADLVGALRVGAYSTVDDIAKHNCQSALGIVGDFIPLDLL